MSASKDENKAIVVGAGIVGVCCAIELQRSGYGVTLVDRDTPGMACSFGNAGALAPWSLVPLALPGIHARVPKMLLDPDGPLRIRLRSLGRTLPWLWRFHRAARIEVVRHVADGLHALYHSTYELHETLAAEAGVPDLVVPSRYLYLYRNADDYAPAALIWQLRRERGAEIEVFDGPEISEIEPALSPIYTRAIRVGPSGRTTNPYRLTLAYADLFEKLGGQIIRKDVKRLVPDGATTHIVTEDSIHQAEIVVVAAGAWSRDLLRPLGFKLPLIAERGYHMMFADSGITLNHIVSPLDRSCALSSQEDGLRVAGTDELGGPDDPPSWRRAEVLAKFARELIPQADLTQSTRWMGPRPGLPDSLPAIGPVPGHPNILLASGHGHLGLSGGPATARLIAALARNKRPNIDISPYAPDRF